MGENKFYIGIDIGGTNITAGIVECERIIASDKVKTDSKRGYDAVCADIISLILRLTEKHEIDKDLIGWIGIGCPGVCNVLKGTVEYSSNLEWESKPLQNDIENGTGIKTFLDNDANCAAYGEFRAGAGKGVKSMVAITLGTGVGSGIITNGQLLYGSNYAGGEFGHTVLDVNGPKCTCGRNGCFEVYSSATGLIRMTKETMAQYPDSLIHKAAENRGRVSARVAFDAAKMGDGAAIMLVDKYITYLANGIANIINIFQPDIISIGGGVCNEGDNLLIPLKRKIDENIFLKTNTKSTKLVVGTLGNDAGIIGAALLGELDVNK